MDGLDGLDGLDWILLRSLVQLEHLAVLLILLISRWQYKIFLLTWIEGVLIGFHHLSSVFLGYTPKHWCKLGNVLDVLDIYFISPKHWCKLGNVLDFLDILFHFTKSLV